MSLNVEKLEKVVNMEGGLRRARCPACAESGGDRRGEHLRIYPDGRFGCCVYPKDKEHRRRIFALAGNRQPQAIQVRTAGRVSGAPVVSGILGRLGRGMANPNTNPVEGESSDASDGVSQIQTSICEARTPRTGSADSKTEPMGDLFDDSRTGRTGISYPCAYAEKESEDAYIYASTYKDFGEGVRSVRETATRDGFRWLRVTYRF